MDGNWKLLAEHAAHRRAELGLSQIEVAQRGPLSLDRVQNIEGAKRTSYRLATLLALERALGWREGSVETILAGGEPQPLPPVARISNLRFEAPVPSDEELRESDLAPETIEALLDMRRHVERLVAKRDEDAIRRANRVLRALDEGQDAS